MLVSIATTSNPMILARVSVSTAEFGERFHSVGFSKPGQRAIDTSNSNKPQPVVNASAVDAPTYSARDPRSNTPMGPDPIATTSNPMIRARISGGAKVSNMVLCMAAKAPKPIPAMNSKIAAGRKVSRCAKT